MSRKWATLILMKTSIATAIIAIIAIITATPAITKPPIYFPVGGWWQLQNSNLRSCPLYVLLSIYVLHRLSTDGYQKVMEPLDASNLTMNKRNARLANL